MSQQKIEVTIADRTLKIACPLGHETELLSAANELNERLVEAKSRGSVYNNEQLYLMTALNLSNDLLLAQHQLELERKENKSKIELLTTTFKQALINKQKQQT